VSVEPTSSALSVSCMSLTERTSGAAIATATPTTLSEIGTLRRPFHDQISTAVGVVSGISLHRLLA